MHRRMVLGAVALLLLGLVAWGGLRVLTMVEAGTGLTGTTWAWQSSSLNPDQTFRPEDPTRYTLRFEADGRVAVRADCNQGGGSYRVDGDRLSLGPIATTLIGCPPGSLDGPFLSQLNDVSTWSIRDGILFLGLGFDNGAMRFAPIIPAGGASGGGASGGGAVVGGAAVASGTVSGVVTYRQRIALPPDARIQVQIEDSSRADAPAIVIGEQTIETAGRQVPIPFAVTYDPGMIDPRFRYTLRVRITDGEGRLRFINTSAYPVITNGNTTEGIEVVVEMVGS